MNHHGKVESIRFDDGERFSFVSDADGIPVFESVVYGATTLRMRSGSSNSDLLEHQGVACLLRYLGRRGIDLDGRIRDQRFLTVREIDGLVHHIRSGATGTPTAAATGALRLWPIIRFIRWKCDTAADASSTLAGRRAFETAVERFIDLLEKRVPRFGRNEPKDGLGREARADLVRALQKRGAGALWIDPFVACRNQTLVEFGLATGLRRGEMLSLRKGDFDLRGLRFTVRRRPAPVDDRRPRPALVKGLGRTLGMTPRSAALIREYVSSRDRIPAAGRHDILLVSSTGDALSEASVNKLVRTIRDRVPSVGEGFTLHTLRYTWNDRFSDHSRNLGLSRDDELRARMHAMGWSGERTAEHYLRARAHRQANVIGLAMQADLMSSEASQNG